MTSETPSTAASAPKDGRWNELVQSVRDHRDTSVARVQPPLPELPVNLPANVLDVPAKVLTEEELAITEKTTEELLELLTAGKISSVKVTTAFLRRSAVAQKLVNCVTELRCESALDRAEFLDKYYTENKKPIGPLHGLPVSVKDHLTMKGWESNFSFVARIGKIATTDGLLLKALHDAGAVFHARTTQPQTLMHLETSSTIYGVTTNPHNRALTPGGSSGGEGALIAMNGSVLGVGSDTGGSIRVPAGFSGIYGLKPTSGRVTLAGLDGIAGGREQVPSVVGPMSSSLHGLALFMKVVVGANAWKWDPSIPPVPWRDEVDWLKREDGRRKLKIGVMWDDGIVVPHPPVRRALRETVEKLRAQEDVEVVEWHPFDHELGFQIWNHLIFADNGRTMLDLLAGGEEELRPLTKWILVDNPLVANRSLQELWDWTCKRDVYRAEYARIWNETGDALNHPVDVILSPVFPGAASPLDQSKYWNYSLIWNILDYPGLSFPVTKVDQEKDKPDTNFRPRNGYDLANHQLYDPEVYKDAPVSLQLIGRRFEDEKLLQAMHFIEDRLESRRACSQE